MLPCNDQSIIGKKIAAQEKEGYFESKKEKQKLHSE